MALLNQLLSERDLGRLTLDEREFLVERIDHVIANQLRSPNTEAHKAIVAHLGESLKALGKKDVKLIPGA